jgi:hypothetical protein
VTLLIENFLALVVVFFLRDGTAITRFFQVNQLLAGAHGGVMHLSICSAAATSSNRLERATAAGVSFFSITSPFFGCRVSKL